MKELGGHAPVPVGVFPLIERTAKRVPFRSFWVEVSQIFNAKSVCDSSHEGFRLFRVSEVQDVREE